MIKVLGLGNVLMGDDGFGPAVIHAFTAAYRVDPSVEVIDLGTPGLDLLPWLADIDRVVIVDTVKSSLPPGTMRLYQKSDVLRHPPSVRVGPHDPGVKDALLALEFAGRAPRELTLIGVVPSRIDLAVNLSPPVQAAVPRAVAMLARILTEHGAEISATADASVGDPWWSASCEARTADMEGL